MTKNKLFTIITEEPARIERSYILTSSMLTVVLPAMQYCFLFCHECVERNIVIMIDFTNHS